jgi:hypothetical protein
MNPGLSKARLDLLAKGLKPCPVCRETKPLSDFYRKSNSPDGVDGYCKTCARSKCREWLIANPDKARESGIKWRANHRTQHQRLVRNAGLKRSYGITNSDFDRMIIAQSGMCGLCGKPFDERKKSTGAHVDHDHATNRLRSLIHNTCNLMLGCVDDDIDILKAAVEYLKSWA